MATSEEYYLTINCYSNYAERVRDLKDDITRDLDSTQNVFVRSDKYYASSFYDDTIRNYSGHSDLNTLIMRRTGYLPTRYWNTNPDGTGIRLHEGAQMTGQEMAKHFGLDLSNGNATLNVYPEWIPQKEVFFCKSDGFIYASDFIVSDEMCIKNNGCVYAPSFIEGDSIYISDNGFVAKGFRKGSPDYPYASLI